MCKRIFQFELQLSSYWQNITFSRYCPKFHIFTKLVIFQVYLHLFRPTASSLLNSWQGHVRNTLFHFCQLWAVNVKEWKVHSLSEWKQFHSYRVNFHSEKSEILLCHSFKSGISLFKEWNFHSFRVNFSLFLRIGHSSHSLYEWFLLCLLKFKFVHSQKRVTKVINP